MNRIDTLFEQKFTTMNLAIVWVGILCSSVLVSLLPAQSAAQALKTTATAGSPTRYQPDRFAGRARVYYASVWGVDSLSVKAAESGELIRFSYRILDPRKARVFNEKKIEAYLNSPEHHIQLVIPSLEKVGQLRQINTPVAGNSYWMAFSNPHRSVKRGDRVNVVIGQFHADGLVVE
jgi:hypothetical protein